MAQIGTPPPVVQKRGGAASDIYTVLTVVAFLALVVGVGYVFFHGRQLYPGTGPFDIQPAPSSSAKPMPVR